MILTVIGILLAVISSVCSAYANVLLKLSHNNKEKYDRAANARAAAGLPIDLVAERKAKRGHLMMWIMVLLCYAGNVIFRFVALALVPMSIIAPSSALTIAFNALLAYYYFRERLGRNGTIGTSLVLGGCAIAMIVGKKGEDSFTVEELLDMYNIPFFYVFAVIQAIIFLISLAVSIWYLIKVKRDLPADVLEQLHAEHLKAQADAIRAHEAASTPVPVDDKNNNPSDTAALTNCPISLLIVNNPEPNSAGNQSNPTSTHTPTTVTQTTTVTHATTVTPRTPSTARRGLNARANQLSSTSTGPTLAVPQPEFTFSQNRNSPNRNIPRNPSTLSGISQDPAITHSQSHIPAHTATVIPTVTIFDTNPTTLRQSPSTGTLLHSASGAHAFDMHTTPMPRASSSLDAPLPTPLNTNTTHDLPHDRTFHTNTAATETNGYTNAEISSTPTLSAAAMPRLASFLDNLVHSLSSMHPSAALETESIASRRASRALSHASADPVAIIRNGGAISGEAAAHKLSTKDGAGAHMLGEASLSLLVPTAQRIDSSLAEDDAEHGYMSPSTGTGSNLHKSESMGGMRHSRRNRVSSPNFNANDSNTGMAADPASLATCDEHAESEEDAYDLYNAHDGQAFNFTHRLSTNGARSPGPGNSAPGNGNVFPVTESFLTVNMSQTSTLVPTQSSIVPVASMQAIAVQEKEAEAAGEVIPDVLLITRRLRVLLLLGSGQRGLLGMALGYIGSFACCWMNLTAKSLMASIKQTIKGDNQFDRWELYLLIIGLVVSLIATLKSLSFMMSLFDAVMIVPIYQCLLIVGLILVGIFYFDEFAGIHRTNLILFIVAIFICLVGIVILTQQKAHTQAASEKAPDVQESRPDSDVAVDTQKIDVRLGQGDDDMFTSDGVSQMQSTGMTAIEMSKL